jgi:ubiquinone/menaquinone biosynthesis C-methylase UbiE
MDAPTAGAAELEASLAFIERVNCWLGYTRATIAHLDRLSRGWPAGRRLSILDVATGSGDVPRAVCAWADRRGIDVGVVGVDLHPVTLSIARQRTSDPRISLVRGDALALPFVDSSFDVVLCSMFLHHLDEGDVIAALREIDRVARRGVIVADLLRSRRALVWITLFTMFAGAMVKHDARASVRQAFTVEEFGRLADAAGLRYARLHRHFGHRFVLSGSKHHAESTQCGHPASADTNAGETPAPPSA